MYSFIASGADLLVAHGQKENFEDIVKKILGELPKGANKAYVHEANCFYFLGDEGEVVVGCVAAKELRNTTAFAFLKEVKKLYGEEKGEGKKFKKVLKKQMERFSNEKEVNKIVAIQEELEDVKNVMRVNIDKLLERGDKLSTLEDQTASLEMEALGFKKRSQELHRSMWCASLRMKALLAFIILAIVTVFVLVILFSVCGTTMQKCSPPPPAPPLPPQPAPAPSKF
uniref:V-SNARE coiled-coil homology domain-containing protein n=1 Tax=Arcella intermedia TaxID=1963864 RepID=A0A6B2LHF2_9EUKA